MIEIITQSGKCYLVDDQDRIIRTDMQFTPSGQWLFKGIVPRLPREPFGYDAQFVRSHLQAGLPFNNGLAYKNGSARYTVADMDHGTYRHWGDAVRSLRLVDAS